VEEKILLMIAVFAEEIMTVIVPDYLTVPYRIVMEYVVGVQSMMNAVYVVVMVFLRTTVIVKDMS
jgi:hypothetical protein